MDGDWQGEGSQNRELNSSTTFIMLDLPVEEK